MRKLRSVGVGHMPPSAARGGGIYEGNQFGRSGRRTRDPFDPDWEPNYAVSGEEGTLFLPCSPPLNIPKIISFLGRGGVNLRTPSHADKGLMENKTADSTVALIGMICDKRSIVRVIITLTTAQFIF